MNVKIGDKNYDVDSVRFENGIELPVILFAHKLEAIKEFLKANDLVRSNEIRIQKVIFSGPATIVFWEDGDKTIVKCMDGDPLNYEMGIAMCTLKKLFGEEGYRNYKKHVKELLPEEKVEKEVKENEEVKT